jgi:pimeloyl-ACP methyl ester carboxylesterase
MHTILVPPLLGSAMFYEPILDTVWRYGGVSIADTRRDETMAAIAARILDDAPDRFALLGTSMGGYIALEIVRQAPDRVTALALVSTSARVDTPDKVEGRLGQNATVEAGGFDGVVEAAFPGLVASRNEDDAVLRDAWRATANAVGPEAFVQQQKAIMARADSLPLLRGIDVPTAVIHGTGDRLIPLDIARETAAAVSGAQLSEIPDAGHFLVWEKPEAAASAVSELLDRVA